MTSVIDQHVQTFDEMRRIGLICHGLDLSIGEIFSDEKKFQPSDSTRRVLKSSLSSNLLHLAIAIRVNIYQGSLNGLERRDLPWWASLYFSDEMKSGPVNLKTICDKIIHANSVDRSVLPNFNFETGPMCMHFVGTYGRREWVMDFPVSLFVEYVLAVLDEIESPVV